MKTPVLITGGCGYIGSHIVYNLIDAGYQPIVIDALFTSRRDIIPADVPFYKQDISDTEALKNVLQKHDIKTVIHMAAFLSVEESVYNPLKYYKNNVAGTCNLLQACVEAGVKKLIFSSTGSAYASSDKPLLETDPSEPGSPYSQSKLMAEKIIRDTTKASDLKAIVLRYFNVVGADLQGRTGQQGITSSQIIPRAFECALGHTATNEMKIFGTDYKTVDGTCVRDYIHVSDLAEIHRVVMEQDFADPFRLFNCGYGIGSSVKQIIDKVQSVTGLTFPVTLANRRPGDQEETVANNTRLLTETSWRPKYNDMDMIVKTAWNWYQREAERVKRA